MWTSTSRARRLLARAALAAMTLSLPATADASLTITPANASRGFVLTDFVSGFPNSGAMGPIGIAFRPGGQVLVTDPGMNALYSLPGHTDGQLFAPSDSIAGYASPPWALAQVKIGGAWH